MRLFYLLVTFVGLMLTAQSSLAHHAFAATFDIGKEIKVAGVITKYSFEKNPHIMTYMDVTSDDGSVINWVGVGAAATLLRRAGWNAKALEPGAHIHITGSPTHDGSPMISVVDIELLDADNGEVVAELSTTGYKSVEPVSKVPAMPLALDDGTQNLTGAWTGHGMDKTKGPPAAPKMSFNANGQALQAAYDLATDAQIFCDASGLVRQAGMTPLPIKITQLDDHIVFEYEEYGGRREMYFNNGVKTHLGDSVARYEGQSLIVESTNLLSNLTTPDGNHLSDQTTVVETYKRVNNDKYGAVLSVEVVASDPGNLVVKILSFQKN